MLRKKMFAVCVVLSALFFFAPWFTFNAAETGYYNGSSFFFLALPFFVHIIWYCTKGNRALPLILLMELSLLAIPAIMLFAYCRWTLNANIGRLDPLSYLHTVQPTFGVGLAASLLALLLYQFQLFPSGNKKAPAQWSGAVRK